MKKNFFEQLNGGSEFYTEFMKEIYNLKVAPILNRCWNRKIESTT